MIAIASTASPHRSPTMLISSGMISAPSAIVAINPVSRAPNTRPSTASGLSRCRIVEALTSTTGLAAPITNMARNAGAACGQTDTSSRGSAQNRTPTPKSDARRNLLARPMASSPPSRAPTPSTESR